MYPFDNEFLLFESNLSVNLFISKCQNVQGIHQLLVKPKYFGFDCETKVVLLKLHCIYLINNL